MAELKLGPGPSAPPGVTRMAPQAPRESSSEKPPSSAPASRARRSRAHLANANVKPVLFDLPAKEGKDKSAIAIKAIAGLAKMSPSPLSVTSIATQIQAANYDEHLDLIKNCDLVIEAISERMDWMTGLFS